jgi:oligoendopeptidase F
MWDDLLPEAARRVLGVPVSELTRSDALALLRGSEFDAYFPAREMEAAIRRQVGDMGIDPVAGGRIRYDVGEREGKRSRAFCAPVRVPDEVYLVLRPHGGQTDYQTLLHELGHALHFAYTRPDYPFEYRWVGDNSVTEGYAMLFDHLMQTSGWLLRYSTLGRRQLPAFLRAAALEELQFLRRYCAKLIYETELYESMGDWEGLSNLYVETLTAATSFRYRGADAFIDVDARFYAARYLRAWQLGALLATVLTEHFDEDWYRNPRAGPWLIDQLLSEGQRELADELAARVAGRPLSFGPVIAAVEALVA